MIIMITLGIGIFLGFNMEWYTIEYDSSRFFNDTNYADFRLYDQNGFTADDLDKIAGIDGVNAATRFLSVNLDLKGKTNKSLALDVSENYTVSTFVVMSGENMTKTATASGFQINLPPQIIIRPAMSLLLNFREWIFRER